MVSKYGQLIVALSLWDIAKICTYLGAKLTQQMCICLGFNFFCERYTQTCQTAVDLQSCSGGTINRERSVCGKALAAASSSVLLKSSLGTSQMSWYGVMLMGFSPVELIFLAGFPPCRALFNTPPKSTGAFTGMGELWCCLYFHSLGSLHGAVQCLLQVLHSYTMSKCI